MHETRIASAIKTDAMGMPQALATIDFFGQNGKNLSQKRSNADSEKGNENEQNLSGKKVVRAANISSESISETEEKTVTSTTTELAQENASSKKQNSADDGKANIKREQELTAKKLCALVEAMNISFYLTQIK